MGILSISRVLNSEIPIHLLIQYFFDSIMKI